MKVQSAVLAMAIASALVSGVACSAGSDSPTGTGGTSANGGNGGATGTGSGGAGGSCSNVMPCGGSVVGTWTVMSSCLKVTGGLDLALVGAAGCPTTPVTGSLQVTGTFTANADGTYLDNTTTSGEEQFTLTPACLVISSTPVNCDGAANFIKNLGFSTLTCTSVAGGGCSCSGTVNQKGGIGTVSVAPPTSGNHTSLNNMVTLTGDAGDTQYAYCASSNTLTMTPQTTKPVMMGTIVLQKSGQTGTGGGGATGSGGSTAGTGGTSAGTGGRGGAMGTGGTNGTGGRGGTMGTGGTPAGTGGRGGAMGSGGASGSGGTAGAGGGAMGPCDIYKSGGTACVAAHSTVRALFGAYAGKLYQVRNAAGTTRDINTVTAGGVADAAAQDTFCTGTTCVITVIYDQSGKGNDLWYQGSGSPVGGQDQPATATTESIRIGGSKAYSLYIKPRNSYWLDGTRTGIPTGSQPEGMYMVTSGTHFNSGCCFDYGNSEIDRKADGAGTMDALNFSTITAWGTGAGNGPWVLADLEYGLFAQGGGGKNQNVPTQTSPFVTAVLKNNGTTEFALRGGNSATGSLSTYYKGALPAGWSPMKKQGAMVLGSGGDCCATNTNLSEGTFYEGCLVAGYPSDATENAVQANIVAAGYSK